GSCGAAGMRRGAGRDFADEDGGDDEPVVIVSQTLALRLFANGDAVNRKLWWTDPMARSFGMQEKRRIVGVVADVDDEQIVRSPALTVYLPVHQMGVPAPPFLPPPPAAPYPLLPP